MDLYNVTIALYKMHLFLFYFFLRKVSSNKNDLCYAFYTVSFYICIYVVVFMPNAMYMGCSVHSFSPKSSLNTRFVGQRKCLSNLYFNAN